MSKGALVSAIADKAGITRSVASKAVDAMIEHVGETLVHDGKMALPGFGTFEVRKRPARTGRNPATGAAIELAASASVGFRAGAKLKERIS